MIVANLADIKRAHQLVVSRTGLAIQRRAEIAGQRAVKFVQDKPTFTPRTGNLQKRTSYKVKVRRYGKVLQLRNTAKYAAAIDKGARPHEIKARRKKYLRFIVAPGGVRFAKSVQHPGNKPFRFLRSAVNIASPIWAEGIEDDMTKIARSF